MNRGWLAALVPLYAGAVGLKNAAYDRQWLRERRLGWPVISVGNLSVGGAGKTPVVMRLAELLTARGVVVSVLSRGYGRDGSPVEVVDGAGTAARFGDEPLLIARRLARQGARARVVVGGDRYLAGLLAERAGPFAAPITVEPGDPVHSEARCVHVLDDGFQHRRLKRDVDIVVLHRSDFEEQLLPAGRLREPLSALGRATVLVLREGDEDLEPRLRNAGLMTPAWWVQRSIALPKGTDKVVAFCGIARPAEFFEILRKSGKTVLRERAFRDHHRYSIGDVEELRQMAVECGADGLITTEKDAVRLDDTLVARLVGGGQAEPNLPLATALLKVTFRDEDAVVEDLLRMLDQAAPLA